MQSALMPGERILFESGAGLGRGFAQVRGTLTLTDRRLVFEPQVIRTQFDVQTIALADIASVARVHLPLLFRAGLLGGRGVVRSLEVRHRDGATSSFMVNRPMRWVRALEQAGVSAG